MSPLAVFSYISESSCAPLREAMDAGQKAVK